jgi:hypothetical protein
MDNVHRLAGCIHRQDPRAFLHWPVIRDTMFVSSGRTAWTELNVLRRHEDWHDRWSKAIVESPLGCPPPFLVYPKSSGNLIHHAYHLMQFEGHTGVMVREFDMVFEFGGGYGSMCRLFHNLGFHGRYVIFDLPAFSALQVYYLQGLGIGARRDAPSAPQVCCLCDLTQLRRVIAGARRAQASKALFVATWSLSETPLDIREAVVPLLSGYDAFLIGYQAEFEKVDNPGYFRQFQRSFPQVEWQNWEIDHMRANYYLMGRRVGGKG